MDSVFFCFGRDCLLFSSATFLKEIETVFLVVFLCCCKNNSATNQMLTGDNIFSSVTLKESIKRD